LVRFIVDNHRCWGRVQPGEAGGWRRGWQARSYPGRGLARAAGGLVRSGHGFSFPAGFAAARKGRITGTHFMLAVRQNFGEDYMHVADGVMDATATFRVRQVGLARGDCIT
jgi:hypothetical protein